MNIDCKIKEGIVVKGEHVDISDWPQNCKIENTEKRVDETLAVYYAISEKVEVPVDATDDEIETIVKNIAGDREFVWSRNNDVLEF